MMRIHYIDNVRWATVLLVMFYHVFYIFNGVGVLGGVGSFHPVQYQDAVLYFIYPWFMVLLFLVAGVSARYSLEKLSPKEFLRRRTWKLLVPSTLGLFAFQWIVGYVNIRVGGGLAYIPPFLVYPIAAVSGTGPLWFAQVLWLFSFPLLLIRRLDKGERLPALGERCNHPAVLLLLFLPLWGGAQVLNLPVLTTYRFGIYFVAFFLGYFVISHENVQKTLEKMALPLLVVSVGMGVVYTAVFFGQNYTDNSILKGLYTNLYAWFMALSVLGCARRWLNFQTPFTAYMTRSSYGFYVLHYILVLLPCWYLKSTGLPPWAVYPLALAAVFGGTPVLYALIRRVPVVRTLILGIRREKA